MVVVASLAIVSPAQAQGVFGRSSISMEPGDWDKLKGSLRAVLGEYRVGSRQAWKSDITDRAGEAFLTETFEKKGLKCAQVTHRFTAGQGGRTYTAPLCQVADGSWKLAF
ncbi:MAG: surface antigen [Alphaproteobacteria bacterium]|jgi:surface antigen